MRRNHRNFPDPHFPPDLNALKRGAQAVLPKDFGMVAAYTGIGRESVVAEAGTGSGCMAIQLGRIVKKLYSYEIRKDHFEFAERNIKRAKSTNIILKNQGIETLEEKNLDLIFLDLKDSDKLIPQLRQNLKDDGFLAGYCPNIEQAKSFHLISNKYFSDVFTISSINIEYAIRDFGCRPKNIGLVHTSFLVFAHNL